MLSETILTEEHRQAGLSLCEDDHCVYLMQQGLVAAMFSASGCTVESLREAADLLLARGWEGEAKESISST